MGAYEIFPQNITVKISLYQSNRMWLMVWMSVFAMRILCACWTPETGQTRVKSFLVTIFIKCALVNGTAVLNIIVWNRTLCSTNMLTCVQTEPYDPNCPRYPPFVVLLQILLIPTCKQKCKGMKWKRKVYKKNFPFIL